MSNFTIRGRTKTGRRYSYTFKDIGQMLEQPGIYPWPWDPRVMLYMQQRLTVASHLDLEKEFE